MLKLENLNLNNDQMMQYGLQYLAILQEGRSIPDRHNGGSIKESGEDRAEINALKNRFNEIFGINNEVGIRK